MAIEVEKEKNIDFDALVEEKISELLELIEMGVFEPGNHYGVEQFFDDPGEWIILGDLERDSLLRSLGKRLGVNLIGYSKEEIVRKYHEEGVVGQPTERGADVDVLKSDNLPFEIHVMKYINTGLGTRYDLVLSSI